MARRVFGACWRLFPPRIRAFLRRVRAEARRKSAGVLRRESVRRVRAAAKLPRQSDRVVVFISERPRAREAKLAVAARLQGYRVILLFRDKPNYQLDEFFPESRQYGAQWDGLEQASTYRPRVYHCFSLSSDQTAELLLRYKPGPVIFEFTDLVEDMLRNEWADQALGGQRFCIEHADAIIARDLQVRHARERLGYKAPERVLLIPDLCWDHPAARNPRPASDGIHVALAGNFGLERKGEGDWGYLEIARTLAKNGVHFHVYPFFGWYGAPEDRFREAFSDYFSLGQETGLIHVHRPVEADRLVHELSQYDFGINVVWGLAAGRGLKTHTAAHIRYCGSARNADYLDAGLMVLLSPQLRFQQHVLSRYGAALAASREFLANPRALLERLSAAEREARAARARQGLSIQRHAARLAEFYDSF